MAHYDCSCCGESMGISHALCSNCKAGKCARPDPPTAPPHCHGVSRLDDNDNAVLISFDRKLTDDELRILHDICACALQARLVLQ